MVLGSIFPANLIKVGLESEDKEEAFEELVNLYVESNPAASRSEILSSLRERERKLSTGIKPGVAIPHTQTEQVPEVRGIIGISREGLDYDALDGRPVHVVFLLLSPPDGCALHLRVLKRLALLMADPSFVSSLLEQKDASGVISTINKYEDLLATSM
mgnify:CR=1 FL=1